MRVFPVLYKECERNPYSYHRSIEYKVTLGNWTVMNEVSKKYRRLGELLLFMGFACCL